MSIKVTSIVPVDEILRKRGMGRSNQARRYLAARVHAYCAPYVPMQQGTLRRDASISNDGRLLIYRQPYAHYQYYGEVMAGRAPKHYTGKDLQHSQSRSSLTGPEWDKRMLADRREDLEKDMAAYVGGKK